MTKKTTEQLRELITDVAIEIQPKLNPIPGKKRVAHAHIYGCVQAIFGASYKEVEEELVEVLVERIRSCPNDSHRELALFMMNHIDKNDKDDS